MHGSRGSKSGGRGAIGSATSGEGLSAAFASAGVRPAQARPKADDLVAKLIAEENEEWDRDERMRRNLVRPAASPISTFDLLPPLPAHLAFDLRIADSTLLHILEFLPPENIAACRRVSVRWRDVGNNEALWKTICRRAIQLHHPPVIPTIKQLSASFLQRVDPPQSAESKTEDVTDDAEVSLSITRQRQIEQRNVLRAADDEEMRRMLLLRETLISDFKETAKTLKSYQIAYRTIPLVRFNGVYSLKTSYVRKGVDDMFHKHPGILVCVYHRTFRFERNNMLTFTMLPGFYTEALKEMNKERSPRVYPGWYRQEGKMLRAEVYGPRTLVTKWLFSVEDFAPGCNNILTVITCVVCEHPADQGRQLPSMESENFWWTSVPAWT